MPGAYSGWGDLSTGAFYKIGNNQHAPSGDSDGIKYGFDAARCSSVYGSADTIQPPALSLIPQIKY